jgi:histidyl-tRNA synthetase
MNLGGGSFKSQLKRADKSNALYALILGEQELADDNIGLKPLRSTEDQVSVPMAKVAAELAARLDNST